MHVVSRTILVCFYSRGKIIYLDRKILLKRCNEANVYVVELHTFKIVLIFCSE